MFPSGQRLASHEALASLHCSAQNIPRYLVMWPQTCKWWNSQKENDFGREKKKKIYLLNDFTKSKDSSFP